MTLQAVTHLCVPAGFAARARLAQLHSKLTLMRVGVTTEAGDILNRQGISWLAPAIGCA
jgi:hypothetical protein